MAKSKDNKETNGKDGSWFKRHKVLTGILAIIVLVIIVQAAGGDKQSTNGVSGGSSNTAKTYRFDDRADKQREDVETIPGETATVDGVKMTLSNVEYKTSLSEFETATSGKTYVIADVTLENTSDKTKPYNVMDFRIQTAGGQVLDGAFTGSVTTINSGDMVTGGKVSGKVVFETPTEDGHQYVIWKPGAYDAARAIVQIK